MKSRLQYERYKIFPKIPTDKNRRRRTRGKRRRKNRKQREKKKMMIVKKIHAQKRGGSNERQRGYEVIRDNSPETCPTDMA